MPEHRGAFYISPAKIPCAVVWCKGFVCCATLKVCYFARISREMPAGAPRKNPDRRCLVVGIGLLCDTKDLFFREDNP